MKILDVNELSLRLREHRNAALLDQKYHRSVCLKYINVKHLPVSVGSKFINLLEH